MLLTRFIEDFFSKHVLFDYFFICVLEKYFYI